MTPVTVLVPGIMGSELRLDGQIIWPGPVASLLFPYQLMDELMDDRLVATDIIRRYTFFSPQYEVIIGDLATCGFREDDSPSTLIVFPYDWRRKNEVAAASLADRIDEVLAAHSGRAEVSIVAHSMGGLVARFYLESGQFTGRPGHGAVRRLITLGTPHRGAPLALPRVLGMEKMLWLSAEQLKQAVSDPRYPSAYQLLPPPGEPFVWDAAPEAEFQDLDLYESSFASGLGLVAANVEAARAFHEALAAGKRPMHVRYFCFAGTRQTTATYARVLQVGAGFRVQKVELDDSGDGTVPYWSSTLPGIQNLPVGGEHSVLYKDGGLKRILAAVLGRAGLLAAEPGRVEVAIRERVVEPGDPVHLVLTFGAGVQTVDGQLRIERVEFAGETVVGIHPIGPTFPIHYRGLSAESLGLLFDAPDLGGAYRVAYYPDGADSLLGSDELFVQSPPP